MGVKVVHTVVRGCGERKKGGCYLVSELSPDGELAAFTTLKTAIPYRPPEGVNPNMRGYILIDLAELLEGKPYDDYVVSSTHERRGREAAKAPEIESYGMPLGRRQTIGICRNAGLEALARLHPESVRGVGRHLRYLSGHLNNLAEAERLKAVKAWQRRDWAAVLAALWRMASKLSPQSRNDVNIANIEYAMRCVGAPQDAMELVAGTLTEEQGQ